MNGTEVMKKNSRKAVWDLTGAWARFKGQRVEMEPVLWLVLSKSEKNIYKRWLSGVYGQVMF